MGAANRFEGYLSKQRYDKPNRGAGAGLTQESDSKELDTFVISQLAYNRVLNDRMFLDSEGQLQQHALPAVPEDRPAAAHRRREQQRAVSQPHQQPDHVSPASAGDCRTTQYYLPIVLGGRHEFKAGFDNGYTPEDVDTLRADEVNVAFRSTPTPTAAHGAPIFNTPLHQERAVMTTAFYGQDSYTVGRLNVIGGIRWERVEGYLPAQTTPTSRFFPDGLVFQGVTINGVVQNYTVKKNFDEVREDPLWQNWAPRVAATYDLFGNGKTALKASWGTLSRSDQHRHAAQPERQHQPAVRVERSQRRPDLPARQRAVGRPEVRGWRVRRPATRRTTSRWPSSTRSLQRP